jgi:hypothetical protein
MGQFREPPPQTKATVATDPLFEAWEALKRYLESRSGALTEEVRYYPTPIARCDEQLSKLLEQRAHALNQLRRMVEQDSEDRAHPERPSLVFLHKFIDSYDPSDDEIEMRIVSRLRAARAERPTAAPLDPLALRAPAPAQLRRSARGQ